MSTARGWALNTQQTATHVTKRADILVNSKCPLVAQQQTNYSASVFSFFTPPAIPAAFLSAIGTVLFTAAFAGLAAAAAAADASCSHLTCVAGPYPFSLRAAIRKMIAGFVV
ncbi:hypothetical protein NP493_1g10011 [Ridgeia piscesae]|uniref:Uncharacterized protein n=1 Tax=Ridgeia piscesae TaxID=27915 RepID=A0AAD9PGS5_RIDPI|nr:hypothetical protein NP493_1g10011 [Ridgeia piscesae]